VGLLTSSPTTRIAVTVTFLKQQSPPTGPARPLPADSSLVRLPRPTVAFYRYLYDTVGAPYVWWLRRTMPNAELAKLLASPAVSIHVLYRDHEPAGFFELDAQVPGVVNLSYFGLFPHAVGKGMGTAFLRMEHPPALPPRPLPTGTHVERVIAPTVTFYRYLYNTVGQAHLWWLRRVAADSELATILSDPRLSLHVLYRGDQILGFFELDARPITTVNLSYFGLVPGAIGQGLGTALLRAAIATAWSHHPRAVTVNTCTADHPRALPNYLKAGFTITRTSREIWAVPTRLGLNIPDHPRV